MLQIVCGHDPREQLGLAIFEQSVMRRSSLPVSFTPLVEESLRASRLYQRPHERRNGQLWCPISDAPMATAFANSRFLVPWMALAQWVLFADAADMLALADIADLFGLAEDRYALMCVWHRHEPATTTKMDNQLQVRYSRKNWSSLMLWNLNHPAHRRLALDHVNKLPGRELHRFCWLNDDEIGQLPGEWNHLVGFDSDIVQPKLLHFTEGTPEVGRKNGRWSTLWLQELKLLESNRHRIDA